jgi:hypothetical protein
LKIKSALPAILLLLLAIALRFLAARGDLWFDEVWSIYFASKVKSFWGIFFELHHDNNHHLNTAFIYAFQKLGLENGIRLPPLLFSLATLVLVLKVLGRSPLEKLLVVLVFGFSFPLIHFGGEARGYAFLFFFSLAAYFLRARALKSAPYFLAFHLAQIFAFLSQLSFLPLAVALGLLTLVEDWQKRGSFKKALGRSISFETPTLLFLIVFYFVEVRHIFAAGGPQRRFQDFLGDMVELFLGSNAYIAGLLFLSLLSFIFIMRQHLRKKLRGAYALWLFAFLIFLASPVFNYVFSQYHFSKCPPFPRHFVLNYLFALLALLPLLHTAFKSKRPRERGSAVFFLLCLSLSNAWNFWHFSEGKRGHYRAAIEQIVSGTEGQSIHLFFQQHTSRILFSYHAKYVELGGKDFHSVKAGDAARRLTSPAWLVRHHVFANETIPPTLQLPELGTMEKVAVYPSAHFSGWTWVLYRQSYANLP